MENGRCMMHGGKSTGPTPKHGLRSIRYRSKLADRAAAFLADPEPGNLASELAMARALFQAFSERFDAFAPRGEDVQAMMQLLAEITRIVERMAKIEDRHALTMAEVAYLTARMGDILVKYVPADRRLAAIDELEAVLRLPPGAEGARASARP
jgi:hypothetical protein